LTKKALIERVASLERTVRRQAEMLQKLAEHSVSQTLI
jgi:hypothetical protein